jgi:hypothetical protein
MVIGYLTEEDLPGKSILLRSNKISILHAWLPSHSIIQGIGL